MSAVIEVLNNLLDIFKKPLKRWTDPSLRIERELEKLEEERRVLIAKPQTDSGTRRLNAIDDERAELLKDQARIAARAT